MMNLRQLSILAALLIAVSVTPALAQETSGNVDTVILASTANYPDALVAGSASAKIGAPVLLTEQGALPQETRDQLQALDPSEIIVVGGPAVVSDSVVSSLSTDYDVTRLWGTTRYGTAVEVASHFWVEGAEEAVIVQNSFEDRNGTVLAAAKELADDGEKPILLTPEGTVPAVVLSALQDLNVSEVTVVGSAVSSAYRSSLTEIGVEVDEEISAASDTEVAEQVRDRVTRRMNATTDLVVVATGSYRHSIAAVHFPNSTTYHITSDDDLDGLVAAVNARNVTSVKVAGRPALAEDAAERLRSETDAEVTLAVARAAEAIRLNANLTAENRPSFVEANRHRSAEWADARERAQERVQDRANRTLQLAADLVDANASAEARAALREARVLFSNGDHMEAREEAREAIGEVREQRYEEARDNATRLQERVREETEDLRERVRDLQELNQEFADEMRQNLTVEERLDIIEEFRDRRRSAVRDLVNEASRNGRLGDLEERLEQARERERDREGFEAEIACDTEGGDTTFDITGEDGRVDAEGSVALNTPNYEPSQTASVDRGAGTVDITVDFAPRSGFGIQCTGRAEVERRVEVPAGNWTVSVTVNVDGTETFSTTSEVTVTADDSGEDETEDETGEDRNESESGESAVERTSASADTAVTMRNTAFQSAPTVQEGAVVSFTNDDAVAHTVTLAEHGIDLNVAAGSSVALRFNEPGTYDVVCTLHPGMETTVTVEE